MPKKSFKQIYFCDRNLKKNDPYMYIDVAAY